MNPVLYLARYDTFITSFVDKTLNDQSVCQCWLTLGFRRTPFFTLEMSCAIAYKMKLLREQAAARPVSLAPLLWHWT